jgi:hypothetical protein
MSANRRKEGAMSRELIREKALRLAFRVGRILNVQAVWDEQEAAGEVACYGSADQGCRYHGCCFRETCLVLASESLTTPVAQLFVKKAAC